MSDQKETTKTASAATPSVKPFRRAAVMKGVLWVARVLWVVVAVKVVATLLVGALLYHPAVQRRAVEEAQKVLSESTGYDISIARLRLTFPLHLSADSLLVKDDADTLLSADLLRLHLRVLPLLRAEASVGEADLQGVRVDTKELVGGAHVKGRLGSLLLPIASKPSRGADVAWETQRVRLGTARISDADLLVCLSDTAFSDTTTTSQPWLISANALRLENIRAKVALATEVPIPSETPSADTLQARPQTWIALDIPEAKLGNLHLDTGRGIYAFQGLTLKDAKACYSALGHDGPWRQLPTPRTIPTDKKADAADSLRAHWDYTDAMRDLALWAPFAQTPKGRIDTDEFIITDLNLSLSPLRYSDTEGLTAHVAQASLKEHNSGFALSGLTGDLHADDEGIDIPDFSLSTPFTTLRLGGRIPWSALTEGYGGMDFNLDLRLGWQDATRLARGFVEDRLLALYPHRDLYLRGALRGNTSHLLVKELNLRMADVLAGSLAGRLESLTERPAAALTYNLKTGNLVPSLYAKFLPDVASTVTLPSAISARGKVNYRPTGAASAGDAALQLLADIGVGGGSAHVDANVRSLNALSSGRMVPHNWALTARTTAFPLRAFMPTLELAPLSASVSAKGNAFDIFSRATDITADVDVASGRFADIDLSGIHADARIAKGDALVSLAANTSALTADGDVRFSLTDLAASAEGASSSEGLAGTLRLNLESIDLLAMGFTTDTLDAGAQLTASFHTDRDLRCFGAEGRIESIFLETQEQGFSSEDLTFALATEADTTFARVESGDLQLRFGAKGNLDRLLPRLSGLATVVGEQVEQKHLDYNALRREFPPMHLYLSARQENPVSGFLRLQGYDFRSAHVDLTAHPRTGLTGDAAIGALSTGGLLIDTLGIQLAQDTTGIALRGFARNYTRRNPTKFDARLSGRLFAESAELLTEFYDNQGEKSINLGARLALAEGGMTVSLLPEHPILAYRSFTLNTDNYLYLGEGGQIRADIDLVADDGTGLRVLSEPADSVNDISLSVYNIHLAELSNVIPFLPKMDGILNGDVHVLDNHESLSAMGTFEAKDFAYEGTPLGDLGADLIYLPKGDDEHFASAYIRSGEEEVLEAEGTYFTTSEAFEGNANLHDFPLPMLNAFLEGTDVALDGKAAGSFTIAGRLDKPEVNGELRMDSAHIYSPVYGFRFKLDEKPITVAHSKATIDSYQLTSTGNNPLTLNGNMDFSDLARISMNLNMSADNFELINAKRTQLSTVFGRVFTDFRGSITGTLSNLVIRGKLDILEKTDMTYILKDSPLTVDSRLDDLVQFVSFTDSTYYDEPAEEPMNITMVLGINVSDDATFHCYLSEDGKSYANITGGGALTFRLTPEGDMRLTGRLTAQSGEMKYELPVIPLRTFNLVEGSTIDFTGDPMNPTLNIQAKERMKVLIAQDDDRQKAVAFDVGVAIKNALDQMGLEFTIEAPEDLTVQNQLASMTAEQRSKAAVAMMATGMYITDSSAMSSGFKANNALNAFLQNEIQNIAGNALKSVDLSVGVETGTSLAGTQTTDYSFQFSKRLWGDKVRVIIGGRVSAGVNADNRAESIINNVSVEYKLNKGATQYVRLFYDRDQQDPFEGQLTQTGVGWSVRNKSDNLGDLIFFWRKKKDEMKNEK